MYQAYSGGSWQDMTRWMSITGTTEGTITKTQYPVTSNVGAFHLGFYVIDAEGQVSNTMEERVSKC